MKKLLMLALFFFAGILMDLSWSPGSCLLWQLWVFRACLIFSILQRCREPQSSSHTELSSAGSPMSPETLRCLCAPPSVAVTAVLNETASSRQLYVGRLLHETVQSSGQSSRPCRYRQVPEAITGDTSECTRCTFVGTAVSWSSPGVYPAAVFVWQYEWACVRGITWTLYLILAYTKDRDPTSLHFHWKS